MKPRASGYGSLARRISAALLVAGITCANPAPAPAAEGRIDNPIRFERCAIESRTFLADPFNSVRTNLVTGVAIRFTNLRGVAATRLTIDLRYAGSNESIVESGTFPAGGRIDRMLPAFTGGAYAGSAADCRVTSAAFADGTTWNAAR